MSDVIHIVIVMLLIATIAGFCAEFRWYYDLCSHFRIQYGVLALILGTLCVATGSSAVWICFAIFLLNVYALRAEVPFGSAKVREQRSGALSVLFANVSTSNKNRTALSEMITKMQPDIIGLVEVNQGWLDDLRPVLTAYREKVELARSDNFGIAFYAKRPMKRSAHLFFFGSIAIPSIRADISINGKDVTFIVTHTMPPVGASHFAIRNQHLKELAEQCW